jgi:hypothetical protein
MAAEIFQRKGVAVFEFVLIILVLYFVCKIIL